MRNVLIPTLAICLATAANAQAPVIQPPQMQILNQGAPLLPLEQYLLAPRQYSPPVSPAQNQIQLEQMIDQRVRQREMERQILKHGAGGCTPNFATGGCL